MCVSLGWSTTEWMMRGRGLSTSLAQSKGSRSREQPWCAATHTLLRTVRLARWRLGSGRQRWSTSSRRRRCCNARARTCESMSMGPCRSTPSPRTLYVPLSVLLLECNACFLFPGSIVLPCTCGRKPPDPNSACAIGPDVAHYRSHRDRGWHGLCH